MESCLRRAEARTARGRGRVEPGSPVLSYLESAGGSQFYCEDKLAHLLMCSRKHRTVHGLGFSGPTLDSQCRPGH